MFRYYQCLTVLSDERMLSAVEIAKLYNLWYGVDKLHPNKELVDFIMEEFMIKNDIKERYLYMEKESANVSKCFPVFPEELYKKVMEDFIEYLDLCGIVSDKEQINSYRDIDFIYYEKSLEKQCKIVKFNSRGKEDG